MQRNTDLLHSPCREALLSRGALTKKLHDGRVPTSWELDQHLLKHVADSVARGGVVAGSVALADRQLQQAARDCAQKLGVTGFKASESWLRGWKQRCLGEGMGTRGRKGGRGTGGKEEERGKGGMAGGHDRKRNGKVSGHLDKRGEAHHPSCQLLPLTQEDNRGVALVLATSNISPDSAAVTSNSSDAAPSNEWPGDGLHYDYTTPEHNYCAPLSHNSETTPSESRSYDQLTRSAAPNDQNVATPTSLDVHVEELLEGVALLQEERVGVARDEAAGLVSEVSEQSSFSQHTSALLEDSYLFNHRSFTDHFPFLPPSIFSNWCPPYDITMDGLTAPYQDGAGGHSHHTYMDPPADLALEVRGQSQGYHTRSKARAESGVGGAMVSGAGERNYCISPSTFLDSPPPLGGMSLRSSPPPGAGGVINSPPGGLLANRLFQPIFPDEPEIVFHEIQLGPLHTMQ